jgi:hypothetical protein
MGSRAILLGKLLRRQVIMPRNKGIRLWKREIVPVYCFQKSLKRFTELIIGGTTFLQSRMIIRAFLNSSERIPRRLCRGISEQNTKKVLDGIGFLVSRLLLGCCEEFQYQKRSLVSD